MSKIIGYQIVRKGSESEIPEEFWSFEIFSEQDVDDWIQLHNTDKWAKMPIRERDIQNPAFSNIYHKPTSQKEPTLLEKIEEIVHSQRLHPEEKIQRIGKLVPLTKPVEWPYPVNEGCH